MARRAHRRELSELRDLGLLKLFFGADPGRARRGPDRSAPRASWPSTRGSATAMPAESCPSGPRLALEAGIASEARTWIEFWEELADRSPG